MADFDFELPPDRIALRPAVRREAARLLEVGQGLGDFAIADLPQLLRAGDVLVFNNTKVIRAALAGHRMGRLGTEPKIEVLLHQRLDARRWKAFSKPAKKLVEGDKVRFRDLTATVETKGEAGEITLEFALGGAELDAAIAVTGRMPLPPYIESKRAQDAQDEADYQTMFAQHAGAVAAPTASLHFTPALMRQLEQRGIVHEFVTLHVGAGTFLPIKAEDTVDHKMHAEWGEITGTVMARLKEARAKGNRIIAVGTTSLRLLESARGEAFSGTTDIFITPGYRFHSVDGLLTNFHLPKSTLFMLVCAFAGVARMKAAYGHAIARDYRFYSYGDTSLLWPEHG